ncbi:MAG: sulfite exporter TauE/SafE family protein [Deltaproteobacteria bacterium]|nr:sulfite exporter TauE/SafE family protein [Deltaproteobacteria bacterium]
MQGLDIFSASWFMAIGALLVAAFIRGTTGFGFSLVFTPFMILIMEPKAVIPVNLLLASLSNVMVVASSHRAINVRRLLPMTVASLLGVPIGVFIITVISPTLLKVLIGVITVFFAILLIFRLTPHFADERRASCMAGLASGILNASTSLGGPPAVLFMHNQSWQKREIHPSLSAFFLVNTGASLIGLAMSGMVTPDILLTAASFAPGLVVGVYLGMLAFRHVNDSFFRILSIVVVVGTGILAVLSGLGVMK